MTAAIESIEDDLNHLHDLDRDLSEVWTRLHSYCSTNLFQEGSSVGMSLRKGYSVASPCLGCRHGRISLTERLQIATYFTDVSVWVYYRMSLLDDVENATSFQEVCRWA